MQPLFWALYNAKYNPLQFCTPTTGQHIARYRDNWVRIIEQSVIPCISSIRSLGYTRNTRKAIGRQQNSFWVISLVVEIVVVVEVVVVVSSSSSISSSSNSSSSSK